MSADIRFHLRLMRRRARLFPRQIAVAAVLTLAAFGFLAAASLRAPEIAPQASLQADGQPQATSP